MPEDPSIARATELFEGFLRQKDLRFTRQRAEIVRAMYRTHRHVTADELYEMLRESPGVSELGISRATVYRTLSLMEEGGFVEALDLGRETGVRYEHTLGHRHHDHMICMSCGKIIEFRDEELERVQARAIERHGFRASSHSLKVFGTCETCRDADADGDEPRVDDAAA